MNNRDKNFTRAKVERRRAQLEESVARYLSQLDTADRQEPTEALGVKVARLKEKLTKLKEQMGKLAVYEKQVLASPDQQISLTDPDSRSMATSGRGSGVVGYNVQMAVDTEQSLTASQWTEFSEATGMRQHQKQDRFNDGNNGQVISDIPSKLERRRRMALFLQLGSASGPIGAATQPFIALFLLGYLGLLISNFSYIVPPSLTIWQAAAASATHVFMLMGTLVMLAIIFGYTIFVYWIFSGKLREGEGYH